MILADPALEPIRDRVRDEGCPRCGDSSADIQVIGYEEIILECGHTFEVSSWLDASELQEGENG